MAEHMTATERGHRALREGGYQHHKDGGNIHHSDEAEDKKLIKSELGKARISTRNKGGKIKGEKAGENPGRRHRAMGGATGTESMKRDYPDYKKPIDADAKINQQHPPGDEKPSSYARGGATHGKPGIGKVNIVIAHPGGGEGGAPGAPPMMPPHPPMAPPPMAAPPPHPMMPPPGGGAGMGGPPPAPPGAMPMMRPQGARMGGPIRDRFGRFQGGGV
jgi:hypothetical protein